MIFIVLFSIFLSVNAENGYGYEVEVEPLKDTPEELEPFNATPTGGYTFLGFGGKKGKRPALDIESAPVMPLGPKTNPGSTRYVMDVVLVLDSSYSIMQNGWSKLKAAAKKLIDGLDISPEGTHVSIITYSTDVESYHIFDASATKETLKKLIDDLQFSGQWSRTDLALRSVNHIVFVPMGGARLGNVPKKVILFSDGKTDGPTPPEEDIDWQERVEEQLKPLRKKNVGVFSVAAGQPNMTALAAIAGGPNRVFFNVDNLVEAVDGESLQIPLTESPSPSATVVTTSTLALQGTYTAIETVILTTAITTTPVTTVIRTETQTNLITATETALTVTVSNTQTETITETVTATATQSLTSTAINTATSTVTATATATEVVTLTTTVGVTSTTYAKALATPIPITIVGSVEGKKRNKITRTKRWYENYLPHFIRQWMGIME